VGTILDRGEQFKVERPSAYHESSEHLSLYEDCDDMIRYGHWQLQMALRELQSTGNLGRALKLTHDGRNALRHMIHLTQRRAEIEQDAPNYYKDLGRLLRQFGDDAPHDSAENDLYPIALQSALARLRLGCEVAKALDLKACERRVVIRLIRLSQLRFMHCGLTIGDEKGLCELITLLIDRRASTGVGKRDLMAVMRTIKPKNVYSLWV